MSTSDNNLLNFLQKQSLFSGSPTKNVNRKMSSRSREKRSEQLWQSPNNNIPNNANINNQNFTPTQNFNTSANFTTGQNFNNQTFTTGGNFNANQNFSQGQNVTLQANIPTVQDNNTKVYYNNPNQYVSSTQNQSFGQAGFKLQTNIPNQNSFQQNTNNGFSSFSANIKTNQAPKLHTTSNNNYSFNTYQQEIINHPGSRLEPSAQNYLESVVHYAVDSTNYARGEAMKRLEILADRVRLELDALNNKLSGFNTQMMSIVMQEFNFVKSKVYQIMQDTFRENEKYCRGYISTIETEFNEDVLKARNALQREMENIELMKIDINKPHWESNAVFVSVQFQARVNKVVDQVKNMQIKSVQQQSSHSWEMNLKRDLLDRVILRLQKQRELAFGRAI